MAYTQEVASPPETQSKADIGRWYLNQYLDASTKAIARKMATDKPMLFTVEQARSCLRRLRGNMGKDNRVGMENQGRTEHFRPNQQPGDYFGKIPEAKAEYAEEWGKVKVDIKKALVLADVHVPFHDRNALMLALQYGLDQGCTDIILDGDFADFFSVSYFRRDVRVVDFVEEIDMVHATLEAIRGLYPDGKVIFKEGNHEERMDSYLMTRAPELLGIRDFTLRSFLKLDEMGIEYVGDKRPMKVGDHLYIIHGHEFASSMYNPVNAARSYFLRAKTICLGAHLHATSEHTETGLDGKMISTWSIGCLCKRNPRYRPLNSWNHGFGIVDMTSGSFRVDNLRIVNGKVY